VKFSLGGVGRNIAEAAHRILTSHSQEMLSATLLLSPIGEDPLGSILFNNTQGLGMRTDGLMPCNSSSAVCNMVLDTAGGLIGGVADMDIVESFSADVVGFNRFRCDIIHEPLMI